jgi:photosystem II stability/assembly factor-like uncharacterized protein
MTILALFVLAVPAAAGVSRWTPVGPGAGSARVLAIVPGEPPTIYLGDSNTVQKSTDGGVTWTQIFVNDLVVNRIAVSAARPEVIFMAALSTLP